jgi:hypothetical protein
MSPLGAVLEAWQKHSCAAVHVECAVMTVNGVKHCVTICLHNKPCGLELSLQLMSTCANGYMRVFTISFGSPGVVWATCGCIVHDIFIGVANSIGIAAGLVQLTCWAQCGRPTGRANENLDMICLIRDRELQRLN